MSVKVHILKAGERLNPYKDIISLAFDHSMVNIREKITLPDVDVVFVDSTNRTIPETGVGGESYTKHLVVISINPNFPDLNKSLEREIKSTLAHELNHCARMNSVGAWGNLLEALITEGLADHFDIEINNTKPRPWSVAVTGTKLEELRKEAERDFYNSEYDHFSWFFGSKALNIPRWVGYSIGFDIVKEYMEKTGKKSSELTTLEAREFVRS